MQRHRTRLRWSAPGLSQEAHYPPNAGSSAEDSAAESPQSPGKATPQNEIPDPPGSPLIVSFFHVVYQPLLIILSKGVGGFQGRINCSGTIFRLCGTPVRISTRLGRASGGLAILFWS